MHCFSVGGIGAFILSLWYLPIVKNALERRLCSCTKYGIRQRIYTRGSDETLADAKSAAQEILDGEGKIEKEMTVQSPDVPFIRKGDLVYIMSEFVSDYYYVMNTYTVLLLPLGITLV